MVISRVKLTCLINIWRPINRFFRWQEGGFLAVFHQPSIRSRALPLAEAAPLDTINI